MHSLGQSLLTVLLLCCLSIDLVHGRFSTSGTYSTRKTAKSISLSSSRVSFSWTTQTANDTFSRTTSGPSRRPVVSAASTREGSAAKPSLTTSASVGKPIISIRPQGRDAAKPSSTLSASSSLASRYPLSLSDLSTGFASTAGTEPNGSLHNVSPTSSTTASLSTISSIASTKLSTTVSLPSLTSSSIVSKPSTILSSTSSASSTLISALPLSTSENATATSTLSLASFRIPSNPSTALSFYPSSVFKLGPKPASVTSATAPSSSLSLASPIDFRILGDTLSVSSSLAPITSSTLSPTTGNKVAVISSSQSQSPLVQVSSPASQVYMSSAPPTTSSTLSSSIRGLVIESATANTYSVVPSIFLSSASSTLLPSSSQAPISSPSTTSPGINVGISTSLIASSSSSNLVSTSSVISFSLSLTASSSSAANAGGSHGGSGGGELGGLGGLAGALGAGVGEGAAAGGAGAAGAAGAANGAGSGDNGEIEEEGNEKGTSLTVTTMTTGTVTTTSQSFTASSSISSTIAPSSLASSSTLSVNSTISSASITSAPTCFSYDINDPDLATSPPDDADSPSAKRRAIAGRIQLERRGDKPDYASVIAACTVSKYVVKPAYPGPSIIIANQATPAASMIKFFSTATLWAVPTSSACGAQVWAFNTTAEVSAAGLKPGKNLNVDHVYEKQTLTDFFKSAIGPNDCPGIQNLFNLKADPTNPSYTLLSSVFNNIATYQNPYFIGMTNEFNSIKANLWNTPVNGLLQDIPKTPSNRANGNIPPKTQVQFDMNLLSTIAVILSLFQDSTYFAYWSQTNNLVYNAILGVDKFLAYESALGLPITDPVNGPTLSSTWAARYTDFVQTKIATQNAAIYSYASSLSNGIRVSATQPTDIAALAAWNSKYQLSNLKFRSDVTYVPSPLSFYLPGQAIQMCPRDGTGDRDGCSLPPVAAATPTPSPPSYPLQPALASLPPPLISSPTAMGSLGSLSIVAFDGMVNTITALPSSSSPSAAPVYMSEVSGSAWIVSENPMINTISVPAA